MVIEKIVTDRLFLENLDPNNFEDAYLDWLNDEETIKFLEVERILYTRDILMDYIKEMNDSRNNLLVGIFEKKSSLHVGNIKLGNISDKDKNGDIGILIGSKSHRGLNYGAEAISALSDCAHKVLGLHRVWSKCHETNLASCKAFERAGFKLEGSLRETSFLDGSWVNGSIYGRVFKP